MVEEDRNGLWSAFHHIGNNKVGHQLCVPYGHSPIFSVTEKEVSVFAVAQIGNEGLG